MKICLSLQRRFAPVGHRTAVKLKERFGSGIEFCAYVARRSNLELLRSQQDIPYTSLLLDEDVHDRYRDELLDPAYLAWFEKEYGLPNLWPYLAVDRVIMHGSGVREYPHDAPPYTHEEMLRLLQVHAKAIIEFLEKEKPDAVYLPVIGALGTMLLYHIAKRKGISVLIGAETRLNRGYILSEDYRTVSFAQARFEELRRTSARSLRADDARAYLDDFRAKPHSYLYMMQKKPDSPQRTALRWFASARIFRAFAWYCRLVWRFFTTRQQRDYSESRPLGFLLDGINRKIRMLRGYDDLYDAPEWDQPFAYYPLHYEPEIATLLLGPFWTDQINLVRQIARSLPVTHLLYVKDHPVMLGYRPRWYYRELKKIPNVKLLSPNTDSFELIRRSELVTTISGTAGWEAVIFGKPVITFGDVYYNALSTVTRCSDIEQLPALVQRSIQHNEPNEEELRDFIAAMLEDSEELALHEIWEKGMDRAEEERRLDAFATLLARKLGLHGEGTV